MMKQVVLGARPMLVSIGLRFWTTASGEERSGA
jgi:hypothetical protein